LWTFFLTIIFAFMYFLHYEFGGGPNLRTELEQAMLELERSQTSNVQSAPLETEESLMAAFAQDGVVALGGAQFATKCASCHGPELGGLIGPNLTDANWLHGKGTRLDILKVIREGVAEKGMPPWGPVMKKDELYAVTAFILSKKGSKPVGAKPPQGDAY
jgi:cytochrome c oxidase cbb3-type subunit 3